MNDRLYLVSAYSGEYYDPVGVFTENDIKKIFHGLWYAGDEETEYKRNLFPLSEIKDGYVADFFSILVNNKKLISDWHNMLSAGIYDSCSFEYLQITPIKKNGFIENWDEHWYLDLKHNE